MGFCWWCRILLEASTTYPVRIHGTRTYIYLHELNHIFTFTTTTIHVGKYMVYPCFHVWGSNNTHTIHLWYWYIYLYENHILPSINHQKHVGKYAIPMDEPGVLWRRFVGVCRKCLRAPCLLQAAEGQVFLGCKSPRETPWVFWSVAVLRCFVGLTEWSSWSRRLTPNIHD